MEGGGPFFLGRGTGADVGLSGPPGEAGLWGGAGGGRLDMASLSMVLFFLFLATGRGLAGCLVSVSASDILCLLAGGPGELWESE